MQRLGVLLFLLGLFNGYRTSLIGLSLAADGFYGGWLLYPVAGVSGVGGMFPLTTIGSCAFVIWGFRGHAQRGAGQCRHAVP